jgi:formylglycine-generating enzyme required for sulfatase activity
MSFIIPSVAQQSTKSGKKQASKTAKKPTAKQTAKPVTKPAAVAADKPGTYVESLPNTTAKIKMVPIPGGSIKIGTQTVEIKPFFMATTETPWEAFDAFYESGMSTPAYDQTDWPADAIARPSKSYILPDLGWGHKGYPAINVSFLSVTMFTRWLAKETGKKYRLPTEAEWEWACRAGQTGAWKMTPAEMDKTVWYRDNSDKVTQPVGKKLPNKFGLYDILGNPGEWAIDMEGKPVLCGGTFLDNADKITPTERKRWNAKWQETDPQFPKSRWWLADGKFVGFRVVCDP